MSDSVLADAAKGAAMGLPFGGPVGAAIGGLGGVLAHYAPSLITDLFGSGDTDAAVAAAKAAVTVVQQVAGTSDATAIYAAAADPAVDTQLRVQLAQIAADMQKTAVDGQAADMANQLAMVQAQLADMANARQSMQVLAAGGSKIAWGPGVVSALVLAAFFAIVAMVLLRGLDQNSILVGGLLAMASNIVTYWTGSTAGSASKTQQIADFARRAQDGPSQSRLPAEARSAVQAVEGVAAAVTPFIKGVL